MSPGSSKLTRSTAGPGHRIRRRVTGGLAALIVAAGAGSLAAAPAHATTTTTTTTHAAAVTHPLRPRQQGAAPTVIPGPLINHGGPVQNAPKVYIDYWGWGSDPNGEQP